MATKTETIDDLKGEIDDLEDEVAELKSEIEDLKNDLDDMDTSSPIIRRALDACDKCKGIPDMSINRCAVCRILQQGI